MPAKPWVTFRRPDPEGEYIALLSELPLKRFRDLGEFLLYTWQVQNQLRSAPGLVGYSLKARVLTKRFWTLSVWEAEADLRQFVGQVPHSRVMTALGNKTHFLSWSIRGSQYHPSWQAALGRRRAAGLVCSFCGANQASVEKLIAGPDVYICDRCVHRLVEKLPESARPAHHFRKGCSGNSRVTVGSCLSGFARAARLGPTRVPSVSGARTGARLFLLRGHTGSARTALARASRSSDPPPAVSPTCSPTRPGA